MTWLAIVFFCFAENDCHFWLKETASSAECSKAMSDVTKIMNQNKVPVLYGTCTTVKGKSV